MSVCTLRPAHLLPATAVLSQKSGRPMTWCRARTSTAWAWLAVAGSKAWAAQDQLAGLVAVAFFARQGVL